MNNAYIVDAIRTPIGRYGGTLAAVRADDLGAVPLKALMTRNPQVDWAAVEDIIYGCANQAGEDNRSVARMSLLLAGLPETVSGTTINRLCGSGIQSIVSAAQLIKLGEAKTVLAGGMENMSQAPYVLHGARDGFKFGVPTHLEDLLFSSLSDPYGDTSMAQTAEAIARDWPGIAGYHDLRTRRAGTDTFIQVHIELDDHLNLLAAHVISDRVELALEAVHPGAEVLIHIDPVSIVGQEPPPPYLAS